MRAWPVRLLWSVLILFLALFMTYAARYAYRSVVYRGDNVSFTACPAPLIYGENDGCVAALQRLLDAAPPHAGLHRDGIFGQETLLATREFQSMNNLEVTGKADPETINVLRELAPQPGSLPISAALLTAASLGIVLVCRRIRAQTRP
jgi:peptidoglycan hydrolase-like protein with peptidoglycan-binding domain